MKAQSIMQNVSICRKAGAHMLGMWPQGGAASQRERLVRSSTWVAQSAPERLSSIAQVQAMPAQTAEG